MIENAYTCGQTAFNRGKGRDPMKDHALLGMLLRRSLAGWDAKKGERGEIYND